MQINYNDILSNQQTSTSKVKETGVAYATNPSADIPVLQMHQHSTRDEFYRHYEAWYEETMFTSSSTEIRLNPHFRAIVNMGTFAVPYIIEVLKKEESSHLTWALSDIYGRPISNLKIPNSQVCKLWLQLLDK